MILDVIDNFLPDYYFKSISDIVLGDTFPWHYNDYTIDPEDNYNWYQFSNIFYNAKSPWNGGTDTFHILSPVIQKITGGKTLERIKGNLNPKTLFHRNTGWHFDYKDMTTAILYLNTCNGWTKFKKGGKVDCVANRVVIFNSNLEHAGITCTDQKRKVVINFNYYV